MFKKIVKLIRRWGNLKINYIVNFALKNLSIHILLQFFDYKDFPQSVYASLEEYLPQLDSYQWRLVGLGKIVTTYFEKFS